MMWLIWCAWFAVGVVVGGVAVGLLVAVSGAAEPDEPDDLDEWLRSLTPRND
jgi:hypothetical protein